jgi:hypothetical protein
MAMTRRPRWLLFLPVVSTVFGAISGSTIDASLPFAAFGLLWGVVTVAVAPRIAERGKRSAVWANVSVYITFVLSLIALGGALLGDVITTSPQDAVGVFQKAAFGAFFATIHATFEWILLPLALAVNWSYASRRRWLIVAAALFYAGRIASSLYFAPRAMAWGADPTQAVVDDVQLWLALNWLRTLFQDGAIAAILTWITLGLIPRGGLATEGAASAPYTRRGWSG